MRVAVVGLGKLGAPLAAVLASKGNDVLGVDVNENAVELVNNGRAPVDEPGLQDLITSSRDRLTATTEIAAAADTEASILLVPTPSNDRGAFSNDYLLAAIEAIGRALADRSHYHVVVVGSTVMPGSCDGEIRATLERASDRVVGETVGLCYSPEFIALGLDTRIGKKYLRGAIAYGGPCFPRDNKAFATLARDVGAEALLAEATDAVNVAQTDRLARIVQSQVPDGGAIGILGLAYKPDTSVIEESAGVALARIIAQAG